MSTPQEGPARQVCTFSVGDLTFGVDVQNVHEVIRAQRMTLVPMAPSVVRGLINLRGRIVTAVDMRARLRFPPLESEDGSMNVVVQNEEGAVSLLVDEIGDVLNVAQSLQAQVPPGLSPIVAELVESVYKLEDDILLVLNPNAVATIVSVPAVA
ncbi:MAG: chemotaxis protein CheW [Nannocystaceae bacterium]|nr:chemotaxis protein CheW [Nannocystaceae bacterium]